MRRPVEHLPSIVYTCAQVRELDRIAIEQLGIPGYTLMCRAGEAALDALRRHWPDARRVTIYCGAGNNAGDGYVVARLARAAGLDVRLVGVGAPEKLRGDALRAFQDSRAAGLLTEHFDAAGQAPNEAPDVIVDALLGTGLARPLDDRYARAVEVIDTSGAPVLALDVPSGLDADTGAVLGAAVRASVTITFVGLKQGLFLGDALEYRGELEFASLELPAAPPGAARPVMERLSPKLLEAALPPRSRSAHKGDHGRVVLIGGGPGMSGAIRLAAEAALRVGAGLVYVGTHRDSVPVVMSGRPEIMCRAIESAEDLDPLLEHADSVVIGPGLGRSEWARSLWQRVLSIAKPLVVDADGLNLLAELAARDAAAARLREYCVLTPHPGEAARLLGRRTAEIQRERLAVARELAARYGAIAVLKGAGTLIAAPEGSMASPGIAVCDYGNPGMATAGMGDVLSGVLGGLLGQLREPWLAARVGVLLHALAGDTAATEGERGTVAADLLPALRQWSNPR